MSLCHKSKLLSCLFVFYFAATSLPLLAMESEKVYQEKLKKRIESLTKAIEIYNQEILKNVAKRILTHTQKSDSDFEKIIPQQKELIPSQCLQKLRSPFQDDLEATQEKLRKSEWYSATHDACKKRFPDLQWDTKIFKILCYDYVAKYTQLFWYMPHVFESEKINHNFERLFTNLERINSVDKELLDNLMTLCSPIEKLLGNFFTLLSQIIDPEDVTVFSKTFLSSFKSESEFEFIDSDLARYLYKFAQTSGLTSRLTMIFNFIQNDERSSEQLDQTAILAFILQPYMFFDFETRQNLVIQLYLRIIENKRIDGFFSQLMKQYRQTKEEYNPTCTSIISKAHQLKKLPELINVFEEFDGLPKLENIPSTITCLPGITPKTPHQKNSLCCFKFEK